MITKTYAVWLAMLHRCNSPIAAAYKDYGGRGIKVCESWHWYSGFLRDMGEKPEGLSLERVDNNAGYCKDNCIWATQEEQLKNRRPNRLRVDNLLGLAGVYYMQQFNNWQVKHNKKYLGTFSTLLDAASCRKKAEHESTT